MTEDTDNASAALLAGAKGELRAALGTAMPQLLVIAKDAKKLYPLFTFDDFKKYILLKRSNP